MYLTCPPLASTDIVHSQCYVWYTMIQHINENGCYFFPNGVFYVSSLLEISPCDRNFVLCKAICILHSPIAPLTFISAKTPFTVERFFNFFFLYLIQNPVSRWILIYNITCLSDPVDFFKNLFTFASEFWNTWYKCRSIPPRILLVFPPSPTFYLLIRLFLRW